MNNISKIALGCHKIQDGFEKRNGRDIIYAALDNNITHFDTAPRYGDSELMLGQFLQHQQEVTISSKVGLDRLNEPFFDKHLMALKRLIKAYLKLKSEFVRNSLDKKMGKRYESTINELAALTTTKPTEILTEQHIRKSLYGTLGNLKRDCLDIYFLHEPDRFVNQEEIFLIFNKLVDEGLIKKFGMGFHRWLDPSETYPDDYFVLSMFSESLLNLETPNTNSMIHGTLGYYKFGLSDEHKKDVSPVEFIRQVSKINPNATFLVAPSNKSQLEGFYL